MVKSVRTGPFHGLSEALHERPTDGQTAVDPTPATAAGGRAASGQMPTGG